MKKIFTMPCIHRSRTLFLSNICSTETIDCQLAQKWSLFSELFKKLAECALSVLKYSAVVSCF